MTICIKRPSDEAEMGNHPEHNPRPRHLPTRCGDLLGNIVADRHLADLMKYIIPLLLVGCTVQDIDSQRAVIETRSIPIVQVVIEGPGGDLVPVKHEAIKETVVMLHWQFFLFWIVVLMTVLVVWAWERFRCRRG